MNLKHNKSEILLQGISLLRQQGYHHTGIKDILNACGIPKGSFYNFFKSKEDFASQALHLYGNSILQLIQKFSRNEDLAPLERLQQYFELLIRANEEEEMRYGCLVMSLSSELAGYNDHFAEQTQIIFGQWIQELAYCIELGQNDGSVRMDYLASDLAEFLYTAVFGSFARSKSIRNSQSLKLILHTTLDFLSA